MQPHSVSYDVQTFANGRWLTVGAFRAREDAVRKAERLAIGPARQAVRVLRETYDRPSGRFRQETIFRRSALNEDRIAIARAEVAVARLLRHHRRSPAGRSPGAASGDWPLFSSLGLRLFALMSGGTGAMVVIERMVAS